MSPTSATSATSSSPMALSPTLSSGSSPQLLTAKPQHNCVGCKRLKRGCDKGFPCSKCVKAGRTCEYRDPADDGVCGPISSAKDIHSLAFGTLLDILVNRPRVREAVSLYFNGVNTWFTIIERAGFERQLETTWDKLPAEASAMALCMALIAHPPNQKPSKGMGDTAYHSTKAILSLVQSKVPMSIQLLQAELLVALYEFSQSMPQQAYLSLGRCLHMAKAFGWHSSSFWANEGQASPPAALKLCSVVMWAIVYVDCLLNVGYQDQVYPMPMHTAGFLPASVVPLPEAFDRPRSAGAQFQFGGQDQGFRDANSGQGDAIAFPQATSACYLSTVLEHLSNPALPTDPRNLSESIWQHAKTTSSLKSPVAGEPNAVVGTDFIALMKLNLPGLYDGGDLMSMPGQDPAQAAQVILPVINLIHGRASKVVETEDRLNRGLVDPCWAFAICYAAQLLISHGDGILRDSNWFQRVAELKTTLDKVSKRWKIAERYSESVKRALDNRLVAYAK